MKLEQLRQRRLVRRAKRWSGQSPWGTASLIVGAGAAVAIYLFARSCGPGPAPSAGPVLIEVSPTEIHVNGELAVRDGGTRLDGGGGLSNQQSVAKTEMLLAQYLARRLALPASVPSPSPNPASAPSAASPASVPTVLLKGKPGVSFALLQCVARAVARAGLGPPRLVNPPEDRRAE